MEKVELIHGINQQKTRISNTVFPGKSTRKCLVDENGLISQ